jgi:hypothetical protein
MAESKCAYLWRKRRVIRLEKGHPEEQGFPKSLSSDDSSVIPHDAQSQVQAMRVNFHPRAGGDLREDWRGKASGQGCPRLESVLYSPSSSVAND